MAEQRMGDSNYEIDLDRTAANVASIGTHLCEITEVEKRVSKAGNEYLNWRLSIVGKDDPDVGKTIYFTTSLTPQSRWKLEQTLDALNAPLAGRIRVGKLVGLRCKVQVYHEEYNGKTSARVDQLMPAAQAEQVQKAELGGSGLPPTKDDDVPF